MIRKLIAPDLCPATGKKGADFSVRSMFLPFKDASWMRSSHFIGPASYKCDATGPKCGTLLQDRVNVDVSIKSSRQ
jgi:hypothetical protein